MALIRNEAGLYFAVLQLVTLLLCVARGEERCSTILNIKPDGGLDFTTDCSNRGLITVPKNLQVLTYKLLLNGNRLQDVAKDSFRKLNSLKSLDLSGNDITFLPDDLFVANGNLVFLDLSRNRLHCDWKVWWLVKFARSVSEFRGHCFTPASLRGRSLPALTEEDLLVDCASAKKLKKDAVDGEYRFRIAAQNVAPIEVPVYCHAMDSDEPREYLTLLAGQSNNYVAIPGGASGSSTCGLPKDKGTTVLVQFSRVHIMLRNMSIDPTDTTFSRNVVGAAQAAYATASVCDGKGPSSICKGGIARLDMRGTPFRIKNTKWSSLSEASVRRSVGGAVATVNCTGTCKKCGPEQPLEIEMIDASADPFSACTQPLGLSNGKIPDSNITASSYVSGDFLPSFGRLTSNVNGGWCAALQDNKQYITVDLGSVVTISGIATQGYRLYSDWVMSYSVFISMDGVLWTSYNGLSTKPKVIQGNFDRNTIVTHWFDPRFRARYVRVNPVTWYQGDLLEHRVCLRLELFGCPSDATSYILSSRQSNQCVVPNSDITVPKSMTPLMFSNDCRGPRAMFAFRDSTLMVHTESGLCITSDVNNTLVVSNNCTARLFSFQLIPKGNSDDASVILKDTASGSCARLKASKGGSGIVIQWKDCASGGFTVLCATRKNTAPFKPSFTSSVSTVKVELNTSVALACRPNGDPTPRHSWTRYQSEISGAKTRLSNTTRLTLASDNSLMLHKVQWDDRGSYFCNAWNSAGNTFTEVVLDVQAVQTFASTPKDLEVIVGQPVMFTCQSIGTPTPKVSWLVQDRHNIGLIQAQLLTWIHTYPNGTLRIANARPVYQGIYTCLSESPGLSRNVSAVLTVLVPPLVSLSSSTGSAHVGDSVQSVCSATGDPLPAVTWYRLTADGIKASLTSINGMLVIPSVSKNDTSVYLCEARSRIGSMEARFNLTVTATCIFLPLLHGVVEPFKVLYEEAEQIAITCGPGFKRSGQRNLQCLSTGLWNYPSPTCDDINECEIGRGTSEDENVTAPAGSGDPVGVTVTPIPDDIEPDACDTNAVCTNTAGSFLCVCEDGYIGDGMTCKWNPTTIRQPTTTASTGDTRASTQATTPIPVSTVSLQTLEKMVMGYTGGQVDEDVLLDELLAYATSIQQQTSVDVKSFLLQKILFALWSVVFGVPNDLLKLRTFNNMKKFSEVISVLLDPVNKMAWLDVRKVSNGTGTTELMRATEVYSKQCVEQLKGSILNGADHVEISTGHLYVKMTKLQSIQQRDTTFKLFRGHSQSIQVDIPYKLVAEAAKVSGLLTSIAYTSIGDLLPQELGAVNVSSSRVASPVLSLSISTVKSGSKLVAPINITFSDSMTMLSPLCVFWSYNSSIGYGWSDAGCRTLVSHDLKSVKCECNHMTHFAVIETGVRLSDADYLILAFGVSAIVGCCLLIFLGVVTCMSHVCCSPYGRSDRRVILVNLCLALVLGVLLVSGGLSLAAFKLVRASLSELFCMLLAGAFQFFVVAFFSWMLVEAVHIFLISRTVLSKGYGRLLWFYVLGWGIPIATMAASYLLVRFNVVRFTSWCWLNRSLLPLLLLVGCPSAVLLLVTLALYVSILRSLRSTGQLLTAYAQVQAGRIVWCSLLLELLHIATTTTVALCLRFNNDSLFHHILAATATLEGIYLVFYHCFLDKVISPGSPDADSKARNRCSYSTKETVTYAAASPEDEEMNGNKYKITRPSKRNSTDAKSLVSSGKQTRVGNKEMDWDNHYPDMYGSYQHLPSSPETPHPKEPPSSPPRSVHREKCSRSSVESEVDGARSCNGFAPPSAARNPARLSNLSDQDNNSRLGCRSNSIVSVETKTSGSAMQGIPVYWPTAPPSHHMSLQRSREEVDAPPVMNGDTESPAHRHRSYIDTDRVSNISSELTGILQELEMLNTNAARSPPKNHAHTITGHGRRPSPPKYNDYEMNSLQAQPKPRSKVEEEDIHMRINMYGSL